MIDWSIDLSLDQLIDWMSVGLSRSVPRNFMRTPALSIADSRGLRVICNVIYSISELIRRPSQLETAKEEKLRAALVEELGGLYPPNCRIYFVPGYG